MNHTATASRFCSRGRWSALNVVLMIIGFALFWPLGLAMLAWIIWGDEIGRKTQDLKAQFQSFSGRASSFPAGPFRDEALGYLEPRLAQLQYPTFRAAGYPIGSGIVEGANKVVVEDRLKGSGMHWAPQSVDPMLALRTIVCADRWEEAWPRISARLRAEDHARRQQRRQRCTERRAARTPALPVAAPPTPDAAGAPDASPVVLVAPARLPTMPVPASPPKRVVNGRPTKAHPWNRRFLPHLPPPPAET